MVWLLLRLDMLGNMCMVIVCLPRCDVINYENNRIFLTRRFPHFTKKFGQKFKYCKNEKSFKDEIKTVIFSSLKGFHWSK